MKAAAFIELEPVRSKDEAYKRAREARANLIEAGKAQAARDRRKKNLEAQAKYEREQKARARWANQSRLWWVNKGMVLYRDPIGPKDRSLVAELKDETAKGIIKHLAEKHQVKAWQVTSPLRAKPIIRARHELMYLLYMIKGWSMPRIGAYLDRDHTSILHGIRCHVERSGAEKPERMGDWERGKLWDKRRGQPNASSKQTPDHAGHGGEVQTQIQPVCPGAI